MPDEDNPTQITTADLVRLFEDLSSFEKEQIAAEMALPLWSKQRGRVYRDMKDRVNTRYLVQGAEVTRDGTGNQVGLEGGKGQFDIVNFVSGTATIDSASNARQLNVTAGGPGALCWDIIVDSNYTGTQGASTTTFTGSTVFFYSTIQGGVTKAQSMFQGGSNRDVNVLVCCGDYFENVTFATANWIGSHGIMLTAQAAGEHGPSVVLHGTLTLPFSSFGNDTVTLDGIKVTGLTTIGTSGSGLRPPSFTALASQLFGGITYLGASADMVLRNTTVSGLDGTGVMPVTGGSTWTFDNAALGVVNITSVLGGFYDYSFSQSVNFLFRNGTSVSSCTMQHSSAVVDFDNATITNSLSIRADASNSAVMLVRMRGVRFYGDPQSAGTFDYVKFDTVNSGGTPTVYMQSVGCDFRAPQNTTLASPNRYIAFYQSAGAVTYQEPLIVGNTFQRAQSGLSISPDADVVTVGAASLTNYVIADNAPGGANIIGVTGTGTTGGGGGALATDAFVTIGHPADLPNSRNIAAGLALTRLDGGAGNDVTLAHDSNATSIPNAHHNALHYKDEHTTNFGRVYVPFVLIGTPPNGYTVTIT